MQFISKYNLSNAICKSGDWKHRNLKHGIDVHADLREHL